MRGDFYPRPPRGGRRRAENVVTADTLFLSTPSARRATLSRMAQDVQQVKFLSTPSARRATESRERSDRGHPISIHALREEGDLSRMAQIFQQARNFYPRPPRGGRRVKRQIRAIVRSHFYPRPPRGGRHPARHRPVAQQRFLSTPSARRATSTSTVSCAKAFLHFYPRPPRGGRPKATQGRGRQTQNFYPRPPRGGRRAHGQLLSLDRVISIHALREEGDQVLPVYSSDRGYFYPRPPRGGRLEVQRLLANASVISIHALREEGDNAITAKETPQNNFYPRPPRGGRLLMMSVLVRERNLFLSTPSARRATQDITKAPQTLAISIHALREEGDLQRVVNRVQLLQFLSTPSARRATVLPTMIS